MGKLKRRRKRGGRGTFGSSRRRGPLGLTVEQLPPRSAAELIPGGFPAADDSVWIELDRPTDVFIMIEDNPPVVATNASRLDVTIREESDSTNLATTVSKLFVVIAKEELGSGRFKAVVSRFLLRSRIAVNPKSSFDKLKDFSKLYEEFLAKIHTSGRKTALKTFATSHTQIKTRTKHGKTSVVGATCDFTGVQVAAVEHEVGHVRHAQFQADEGIEALNKFLSKEGRHKHSTGSRRRIIDKADISFMAWNSDAEHKFHREIVAHEIEFVIALYEHNLRTLEQATTAGNPHPLAELHRLNDVLTTILMQKLGDTFPWKDKVKG